MKVASTLTRPRAAVKFSPSFAFWIFAACNAFTIVFIYFRMPETKGVPLEDIEAFFDKKKSRTDGATSSG